MKLEVRGIEPQRLEISTGGTCAVCGFSYMAYRGHLEPCPRCAVQRATVMLQLVLLRAHIPASAGADFAGAEAMVRTLVAAYPARA